LTLAAAWKFSEQGKHVLVFLTQRVHVEGYAKTIIELHERGFLPSLLEEQSQLQRALAVGREWLGADHPAVLCLPIGVAIHHGRLPGPFLREVEALLSAGVLHVTVASPTVAQGLNLNAPVLLIPVLYRGSTPLTGEEFANVAGRAGRAFVDLEGLIVHVIYEREAWRVRAWRELRQSAKARTLSSGIIAVVRQVIERLAPSGVFKREDAMEYLAKSREAWLPKDRPDDTETMESLIERLDVTVLGLIEALDADDAELPRLLDEALAGSLWLRQISRLGERARNHQRWIMQARAQLIWNSSDWMQRRRQFAMGVGLEAGLFIDAMGDALTALLDRADLAAIQGDARTLYRVLISLGTRLFSIRPFRPDVDLPADWPMLLSRWVSGVDVRDIGVENMRIVEDAFVYRLVWALEAVRMRRRAGGGQSDNVEGGAAAALETGLPDMIMAMRVRAGLPSRVAAMRVITQMQPSFSNRAGMYEWLRSEEVEVWTGKKDWSTAETADLWKRFRAEALAGHSQKWTFQDWEMKTAMIGEEVKVALPGRIVVDKASGKVSVTTPDYRPILGIRQRLEQLDPGLLQVELAANRHGAKITRRGRGKATWVSPE
jgi:hypothetical protein